MRGHLRTAAHLTADNDPSVSDKVRRYNFHEVRIRLHLPRSRIRKHHRNIEGLWYVSVQEFTFGTDIDIDRILIGIQNLLCLFDVDILYAHIPHYKWIET